MKTRNIIKKSICFVLSVIMIIPYFDVQAAGAMKASSDCLELIKEAEGFSRYKYWDYSQWTIGYGTGVGADEYPDGITEEEAEILLAESLATYEGYVNNFADKYGVELKQNQFDAMVSLTYNMGNIWGVYDDFDLKTYIVNGSENYSFLEIAKGFGEWRVAGGNVLQGLVNRRQKETALFLSDRTDTGSEVWRVNDEDGLNLREQPDVSSEKTGFMVMNTIFEVTEKVTAGDGTLWGKTYYEGREQWCSLDYAKYMVGGPLNYGEETEITTDKTEEISTENPEESKEDIGSINEPYEEWKVTASGGLKLREGPGLNYDEIGFIECNEKIMITAAVEADGYLWGKTEYYGKSGWCTLDYAERISGQEIDGSSLKSIYIYKKPDKLEYQEGEKLDLSGIEVRGVYTDGSEKTVTDFIISGFESAKGSHTITVSYMEKTASFRITVIEKELLGIEIESGPDKTVYRPGEKFSGEGLKINGVYSNGTKAEIVDYTLNNIEDFSASSGIKTIEAEYKGFKEYFKVEVSEKYLEDIEIKSLPDKIVYYLGQELNLSGLEVEACYSGGKNEIITDYSVSGYDPRTEGRQEIEISYNGFKQTFNVIVEKPDDYDLFGDLDGNGVRNIFDLILLNKYIDGDLKFDSERIYLADVNGDGFVNNKDVEVLSRIVSQQ